MHIKSYNGLPKHNIVLCNSNIAWGGGEKWHLEAAIGLASLSHKVILMAHPEGALYERACELKNKIPENMEISALNIKKLSFLNPVKISKLSRYFKKEKIDTLILNLPQDLKCAGLAAQIAGIKNIIYRRGSAIPVKNTFSNRYLYGKLIHKLIANSQATKNAVLSKNPRLIDDNKLFVLPNGIDIKAFDQRLINAKSSPSLRPDDKCLMIGNAGRLNKQKAQHLLLFLAQELEKFDINFQIIIAGSGNLESGLKKLAKKLGVEKRLVFTGFMEDLSPFWQSIDLFILSSLWEGFGYVLLEAMLAKKAVLAFELSNIPELIKEGENGLLFNLPENAERPLEDYLESRGVNATDIDTSDIGTSDIATSNINTSNIPDMRAMAKAIREIYYDREKMKKMGLAGRTFAEPNFSLEKSLEDLEKIILN